MRWLIALIDPIMIARHPIASLHATSLLGPNRVVGRSESWKVTGRELEGDAELSALRRLIERPD